MKHPFRLLFALVALCTLFAACGSTTSSNGTPTPTPVTLNVFAAASLTEAFNEIATTYHQLHPTVTIKLNFNGSQILEQQIATGAPADVFASADSASMTKASDAGLVNPSQIFAKNRLVVIVPVTNPGHVTTLKDLAKKGLKIDLATPAVPAGKYSRQVLMNMANSPDYGPSYQAAVLGNVVSEEQNVKAVVQKVQLGEVDAGFVYRTDVTAAVSSKVMVIDIPDAFNVIAQYPIAVVKTSAHATDAQALVQYILSTDGQAILAKYHFLPSNG